MSISIGQRNGTQHIVTNFLGLLHGFFDPVDEIWTTCADIRAEHVTSVTLAACQIGRSTNPEIWEERTSSWTLKARRTFSSDIFAGSPKQYTVRPPVSVSMSGGMNQKCRTDRR